MIKFDRHLHRSHPPTTTPVKTIPADIHAPSPSLRGKEFSIVPVAGWDHRPSIHIAFSRLDGSPMSLRSLQKPVLSCGFGISRGRAGLHCISPLSRFKLLTGSVKSVRSRRYRHHVFCGIPLRPCDNGNTYRKSMCQKVSTAFFFQFRRVNKHKHWAILFLFLCKNKQQWTWSNRAPNPTWLQYFS